MLQQECQERIDYWNSKGLKKSRPNTKAYAKIQEYLKESIRGTGTCVGFKVPIELFKSAVDRFAIVVSDPLFLPVNKKNVEKITLASFIYNPFAPSPEFRNCLIQYAENSPTPVRSTVNSPLYDSLCQSYVDNNGCKTVEELNEDQLKNIALASKKLHNFFKMYSKEIDLSFLGTNKQKTDMFVRHVIKQLGGNLEKFNTRALTYNSVWEMLPNFFTKHGYFVGNRTKQLSMKQIEEKMAYERTRTRPTLNRRSAGVG